MDIFAGKQSNPLNYFAQKNQKYRTQTQHCPKKDAKNDKLINGIELADHPENKLN